MFKIDLTAIAILGIVVLLIMLMAGMNIGLLMFVVGFGGYAIVTNFDAALGILSTNLLASSMTYSLTVIPLFVLMGQFAYHSGISEGLFSASKIWFGRARGGIAMATIVACALFGAICGSLVATTATMSVLAMPEMRKHKYSDKVATGCIATAGTLGVLIPPSTVFIMYGVAAQVSIGRLFASGVVPGILLAAALCLVVVITGKRHPEEVPCGEQTTLREKIYALKGCIPVVILFMISVGGMFAGFFSATEGAAVGAFIGFLFMFINRKATVENIVTALKTAVKTAGMCMLIIVGANMFGYFLTITQVSFKLSAWVSALSVPHIAIMLVIIFIYAVLGCFLDGVAMILLTTPIFLPIVTQLGYDSVWFGCIVVMVSNLGSITPPVGMSCYVAAGAIKDVPLTTIFRGIAPNIIVYLIVIVLLILLPDLVTFLPDLIYGPM